MRILLVIDHLDPGGAQHQMVTLARGLVDRGHDVSCFVYYPRMDYHKGALEEAGIKLHAFNKTSRFSLSVPWALRMLVRQGFDVSLSYLATPNVYNVMATVGTGIPTVVSERSALLPRRMGLGTSLRFQSYRLADRILVNSEHHRESLNEVFPWMGAKLLTIRNGVDLERFKPPKRMLPRAPERLDLLAVGSVHSGKNFVGLIEAARLHRDRFGWAPTVRWVGRKGTREADVLAFEQAEQMLERYGLQSNWQWLGVRRDVPQLLQESDALIHPSFFEGLPNVICEALASGLPVLAGRVCDHPWLVAEGVRGYLFDPSDPSDIARAMQQFAATDAVGIGEMRRQARIFAELELSMEGLVLGYERLFESLCS